MSELNQTSNLMNKTFTASSKSDYINYSARGADLVLIPSQSFTNYAMVHNCVDIDKYGITIPYEYASMVGYSYQSIYDYIEKVMEEHLQKNYSHCSKSLLKSFIEEEIKKLLDYVCDNNDTNKNLFKSFNVQACTQRFDKYFINHYTKFFVFSYIKIEGGFVREHEVKNFDSYDDAIKYFNYRVDSFKNQEWYNNTKLDSNDIWLTDKQYEFAFEDANDEFGSHYFRLDI